MAFHRTRALTRDSRPPGRQERWNPMSRSRALRRLTLALLPLGLAVVAGAPAQAGGVSGPAFYVDHELYRTVATPTDLSGTGAPDSSFDALYAFDDQRSVAEAAPGDPGFNGGRW